LVFDFVLFSFCIFISRYVFFSVSGSILFSFCFSRIRVPSQLGSQATTQAACFWISLLWTNGPMDQAPSWVETFFHGWY
jgi:hypothetical protein